MSGAAIRLVLASANSDKAAEMVEILTGALGEGLELLARPPGVPEVEETGATLVANARLKAHALLAATGTAALADDTGLEVDALGGAPGVRSARYGGEQASYAENVAKLLAALDGAPRRDARFRTVVLVALPGGEELSAEGLVEGAIADEPRGAGGFGYDGVFVAAEGDGRTFAELTAAEKHGLSARGRALRSLASVLNERYSPSR